MNGIDSVGVFPLRFDVARGLRGMTAARGVCGPRRVILTRGFLGDHSCGGEFFFHRVVGGTAFWLLLDGILILCGGEAS